MAALVALAAGSVAELSAQGPYRQELIPGFSSFDVGHRSSPALVDLDGDGDLDAVVGEYYGTVKYFANTGSSAAPAFVEATGSSNPFSGVDVGFASSPCLVDLDGDGDFDAVVGERYGTSKYFANLGNSSAPAFVEATGTGNPFAGIDIGQYSAPELADLDGDGDLDAVVGELLGALKYFANTGSSSVPAFVEATGSENPFSGVDVGYFSRPDLVDLDGDGDLDAVVGHQYGQVRYFANTGSSATPAFVEAIGSENPLSGIDAGHRSSPDLIDLDGDGDLDAVVGESYGALWYLANTGSSSVPAFVEGTGSGNPWSGIDVGRGSSPDLVDLDADGDLDALVGEFFGALKYFANTGSSFTPVFVEKTGSENPFDGISVAQRPSPAMIDLDGDGDADAVVGKHAGELKYFANTGSSSVPAFVEATGSANPWSGIVVGDQSSPSLIDLDGDGDFDAVFGVVDGTLKYFANTGSSSVPAFVEASGSASPFDGIDVGFSSTPELVDLDGDEDLDAVVGEALGTLKYFANSGSSSVAAFVEASGSENPWNGIDVGTSNRPALIDLDGDGDLDALVGEDGGRIVYFRSRYFEVLFDAGFADDFESGNLTAWSNF